MALFTLLAFAGLCLILLDWMWKPKLDMPSPRRIPLIGHLLSFVKSPHTHVTLTAWAESCGDIYFIQLLNKCMVIVSGYKIAYDVLVTRGQDFGGRAHTFRNDLISEKGRDIIFQSINPNWKKLRLLTHQSIKQYGEGLGRIEEIVQQTARRLNETLWRESDKGVIDPHEHICLTVANNMAMLITGTPFTNDDPLFNLILETERKSIDNLTFSRGSELDVIPWLRFLGNKSFQDLSAVAKNQVKIYNSIKKMNQYGTLSTESFGHALFNELKESSDFVNDDIAKVVIFDLFNAGLTTSAAALYEFLLIMASYPNIQEKLFAEISSVVNTREAQISLRDRPNMPYTRACLLELMRYASIAPLTIDHTALIDTEIRGHKIPKGTPVFINLFALHHSEKYWDNPWEYDPERFLSDGGQLLPSDHINRKRLLAFGAGVRVCVGQSFAQARMFILMTSLINTFEVKPVPGETIQHDPRVCELEAILKAPHVKLSFKKRL